MHDWDVCSTVAMSQMRGAIARFQRKKQAQARFSLDFQREAPVLCFSRQPIRFHNTQTSPALGCGVPAGVLVRGTTHTSNTPAFLRARAGKSQHAIVVQACRALHWTHIRGAGLAAEKGGGSGGLERAPSSDAGRARHLVVGAPAAAMAGDRGVPAHLFRYVLCAQIQLERNGCVGASPPQLQWPPFFFLNALPTPSLAKRAYTNSLHRRL